MPDGGNQWIGINGILGTRASLMLDVVFLAMFAILPLLAFSIWLVKYRCAYQWHKRIQLTLASMLAVTVVLFEIDVRLHGWRERAKVSPNYGTSKMPGLVDGVLLVHLFFAVTTALIWIYVIVAALRRFSISPAPGEHSPNHKRWGWVAAIDMLGTAVTGWIFYWLAFVA